ncbi:hypothetical protein DSM43518_04183 [Mycobacterium marinum]|nr:hypothetical protein MM1218R_02637 [Mycobacterium marinum]RFZ01909.1 hypothetical protein DE4381_05069 [Mycobacterium marinum]RFZ04821.1 hypothetical protein DSM43518_04183 [Mycobacterium marinum]RFZ04856.1 hypothetical protein VIMS_05022 [Mycobacterium marinum]RFZ49537.1 hypothetical protein MSS4_02509 [Mycobacterium marinum]
MAVTSWPLGWGTARHSLHLINQRFKFRKWAPSNGLGAHLLSAMCVCLISAQPQAAASAGAAGSLTAATAPGFVGVQGG